MPRTVHIVDDDDAVRDSLGYLLMAAGYEVKSYESASEFLDGFTGEETGCLVTDVRMPGITGLELARRLRSLGSKLPIIVITGHADVPLAVEAMKSGAKDFIEKPFEVDAILTAVQAALAKAGQPRSEDIQRSTALMRMESLSARERDVLKGLIAGKANKAMARELGISPRTVEVYRAAVMTKMQASSLSQLVRMALVASQAV
jgi:two-component system response regulator FixJ